MILLNTIDRFDLIDMNNKIAITNKMKVLMKLKGEKRREKT